MTLTAVEMPVVIERAQSIPEWARDYSPKSLLGLTVLKGLKYLPEEYGKELLEAIQRTAIIETELRVKVARGFGLWQAGLLPWPEVVIEDYGVVSRKVVTNAGVGFIVDAFQNSVELENMKFHGIGTGTNAEAVGDTALQTELTTQYAPDNTRATGSTTESASNIYQTVGTNTLDSGTPAVTEHIVISQAATGGGTGLDRSVFSAINLNGANGDGLQSDYRFTITAGS